jgi:hypothetical protein
MEGAAMKQKPSAKHAHSALARSIDIAIEARSEFEATIEPAFEAARKLAARAAIASDQIEAFVETIAREAIPVPAVMLAGLHQAAARLRAEVEAARKLLG